MSLSKVHNLINIDTQKTDKYRNLLENRNVSKPKTNNESNRLMKSKTKFLRGSLINLKQFMIGVSRPQTAVNKLTQKIINKNRENEWDRYFHIMWSKDNDKFPQVLRELFYKPYIYDPRGFRM